jgi:hypothetical protein
MYIFADSIDLYDGSQWPTLSSTRAKQSSRCGYYYLAIPQEFNSSHIMWSSSIFLLLVLLLPFLGSPKMSCIYDTNQEKRGSRDCAKQRRPIKKGKVYASYT